MEGRGQNNERIGQHCSGHKTSTINPGLRSALIRQISIIVVLNDLLKLQIRVLKSPYNEALDHIVCSLCFYKALESIPKG